MWLTPLIYWSPEKYSLQFSNKFLPLIAKALQWKISEMCSKVFIKDMCNIVFLTKPLTESMMLKCSHTWITSDCNDFKNVMRNASVKAHIIHVLIFKVDINELNIHFFISMTWHACEVHPTYMHVIKPTCMSWTYCDGYCSIQGHPEKSRPTNGWTDWTTHRAAWLQLKILQHLLGANELTHWPYEAIWWDRSGSTLDQVMVCCQYWFIIHGSFVAFTWEQFHKKCLGA